MIIFCHLLNDSSGSPRVLHTSIQMAKAGEAKLFIGSDGRGILEDNDIEINRYWYRRTRWKIATLFTYLASQFFLYRKLGKAPDIPQDAVVYVNTLLPFGAAIWAWRTKRPVVYHLHEVSVTPAPLRRLLTGVAARTASLLMYVSNDHRKRLPIPGVANLVLPNAIDAKILARAQLHSYKFANDGKFNILMLASLRNYKGIGEFMELAATLSGREDIQFTLVLNEEFEAVQRYLASNTPPANITIHSRTNQPSEFYEKASLVLNLSRPDLWVETFGLSIVEAMAFGIPVIAPPIGGPIEIITDKKNGFLLDCRDAEAMHNQVSQLANDPDLCLSVSTEARRRAQDFSPEQYATRLNEALAGFLEKKN